MEEKLIAEIEALPLQPFQFGQFEGKRRIASFGFRYDYELKQLQKADPIPSWLSDVVGQVETFGGAGTRIRQILCTEYDVGVGIGWHRDKPHFDRIFGLSLWVPPANFVSANRLAKNGIALRSMSTLARST